MLIDFRKGVRVRGPDPDEPDFVPLDDRYSVINITPQVFIERRTEPGWYFLTKDGQYVHDPNGQHGHLYTHPFPINDHEFLVSYKVDPADHYQACGQCVRAVSDRYCRAAPVGACRRSTLVLASAAAAGPIRTARFAVSTGT